MSGLTPLSSYWVRLRAKNVLGESEWTPIITATTVDAQEVTEINPPHSLDYDKKEEQIKYQVN